MNKQWQTTISYGRKQGFPPSEELKGALNGPMLERMLCPGPVIQNATSTINYNRYSYCLNNPLKYIDPSGELQYLTQATTGTSEHRSRIDYSGHIGRGRHFNYLGDAIGGGGGWGGVGNSNSYTYTAGGYIDALGNSVSFDEVYQKQILPNAERNASVEYILYLGQGSWTDNNTGLLANPLGNVSVYASFNFNGNYSVKTNLGGANANYASSQGGSDTWNNVSNSLNGAGFTAAGAEYSGSRALSRTMKYVSSASKTTPTEVMFKVPGGSVYTSTRFVSNATKVLKVGGVATGVLGVGMTGYEIYTGQKSLVGEGGLDLIMGGVAFIPGGGWIVSGAYFGGKFLLEATGNDFWNEP